MSLCQQTERGVQFCQVYVLCSRMLKKALPQPLRLEQNSFVRLRNSQGTPVRCSLRAENKTYAHREGATQVSNSISHAILGDKICLISTLPRYFAVKMDKEQNIDNLNGSEKCAQWKSSYICSTHLDFYAISLKISFWML